MEEHNLTCKINNVAPVEHLVFTWFRNGRSFHNETFASTDNKPSNVESKIQIKALGENNGDVYKCEAHMDLGPEGPHLNASKEYAIEVLCK